MRLLQIWISFRRAFLIGIVLSYSASEEKSSKERKHRSAEMTNHPVYSIGQQVGDYLLLRELGRGGFGDVYLAEQIHDRTQVAIKLLIHLMGKTNELNAFTKFIQEARMIHLKHPNIVSLQDFGISREGFPFLVMEYVSGGTLRERHPKGTRVPLLMVIGYVRQIATALQYIHDHRLVHCDIKPENMLMSSDGRVLLSDFSIVTVAHSTRSLILDQEIGGSLPYMAPERFQGKSLRESDQYSLGVVAYEWLCGLRPYDGLVAFVRQQGKQTLPSLIEQVPSLDRAVEQVVFRALEDDPRNRFATVQEFADALEKVAQMTLLKYPHQGSVPEALMNASGCSEGGNILVAPSFGAAPKHPVSLPDTQPPAAIPQPRATRGISRRVVAGGLALAAITLGGGSVAWFMASQGQNLPPARTRTAEPARSNTPTPVALGHVLFVYRKHGGLVNTVAWSPDGHFIASGADDATVQVWNPGDGNTILIYRGHKQLVETVAWSLDGQRIASGGFDNTVQVWNAANGKRIYTYQGHTNYVATVAWSPDSMRIASGSYDNSVRVWDAADGRHVITYQGHTSFVHTVAWSPDGKYIASASFDNTVQVWDAATGVTILTYQGHASLAANAVAWSPDGKRVASGGNDMTVQVWDSADGHTTYTYRGHKGVVDAVAWSPNGRRIASGGDDNTVQVWDSANGQQYFTYRQHTKEVRAVAWSPNGRIIASGSIDKTVQIWGAG
jgi:WD40 repeat protein